MAAMPDPVLDDAALVRRASERFGFGCRPGELARLQSAGWPAWLDTRLHRPPDDDPGTAATPAPALPLAARVARNGDPQQRRQRNLERRDAQQACRRVVAGPDGARRGPAHRAADLVLARPLRDQRAEGPAGPADDRPERAVARRRDRPLPGPGPGHDRRPGPADLVGRQRQHGEGAQREPVPRVHGAVRARPRQLHARPTCSRPRGPCPAGGWTATPERPPWSPARHDDRPKTILGATANFDAPSFVDQVLATPSSPRFVIGRLWYRLVSAVPPDEASLGSLVQAWGPGGDIRATLSGDRRSSRPSGTGRRRWSSSRSSGRSG